jgi:2-isopropylmalate synthase
MDLQVSAQSGVSASAEVTVVVDEVRRQGHAVGNGTLDALFRALQQVSEVNADLEDFSLAAATQGSDALGEAVVTLSQGSHVVVGRAVALDVVEAAGYAYVNALNWLLRQSQDLAGAAPADQRRG